jgi:hypothetical protein
MLQGLSRIEKQHLGGRSALILSPQIFQATGIVKIVCHEA